MNSQTLGNLGEAFVANLLNVPDKFDQAYMSWQAEGYNLFNQLVPLMNMRDLGTTAQKATAIKFERATQGGVEVYATITAAPSINASGNLVVTVDPTMNKFRPTEVVEDNNYVQGRVVSRTATTIVLEPAGDTTSWNASTHFQANMIAAVISQSSQSKYSTGLESLYIIPEYDFNYTQVQRETVGMARRDNIKTYTAVKNYPYWSTAQIDQTITRFLRKKELTYVFGERGLKNAADVNDPSAVTYTGGIRWNIINSNGMYEAMTQAINFTTFTNYLFDFKQRNPGASNITLVCGQDFLSTLQTTVFNTYIVNAGVRNTIGGMEVVGIDVMKWGYLGLQVDIILWRGFDRPEKQAVLSTITGRPKQSHTAFIFSTDPIQNAGGGPAQPAIVPYYFGNNQYLGGFRRGLYDFQGGDISRGDLAGLSDLTTQGMVTDYDAITFDMYSDWGVWVQADRMMWLELAS